MIPQFAAMPTARVAPISLKLARMRLRTPAILAPAALLAFAFAIVLTSSGCTTNIGVPAGERTSRRATSDATAATALEDLYRYNPSAKGLLETAAGYAIFDAARASPATAQTPGVLVDNASKQRTYLTMLRPAAGYGVSYDAFRRVIVFASKDALDRFRASSTAGTGAGAGAAPEAAIVIFDLTGSGVVAVANWGTTKFVVDGPR